MALNQHKKIGSTSACCLRCPSGVRAAVLLQASLVGSLLRKNVSPKKRLVNCKLQVIYGLPAMTITFFLIYIHICIYIHILGGGDLKPTFPRALSSAYIGAVWFFIIYKLCVLSSSIF